MECENAMINDLNMQGKREEQAVNISQTISWRMSTYQRIARTIICALGLVFIAPTGSFAAVAQRAFESPQAGVTALIKAVKANNKHTLRAIFGSEGNKLLSSGDAVEDAHNRAVFSKAYDEAHKVVLEGEMQATLVIGKDEWPMPIPLVKYPDGWRFDTVKGEDEILKRRIGRNELETMQVCLAIVDAEREYAAGHLDSDGVPVYASRFTSSQGKQDGLYWPTQANEAPSPLGALLAVAADEGYARPGVLRRNPYHGYYYRILTAQGEGAPDGARDYLVKGKMIGGFAVIAYPARYGASGVTSFLVNHDGVIYEKDLGPNTKTVAAEITTFNPVGWGHALRQSDGSQAVSENYKQVISSPIRTDEDRSADAKRKPLEFLQFTNVQPGMLVLDVATGGGYTTQLLALAVGSNGTVWAQGDKLRTAFEKRLADHPQKNIVPVIQSFEDPIPNDLPKLDLITIILNYHDIAYMPVDRTKMNQRLFNALKPGGHLVVIDHAATAGAGISVAKSLHRIEETVVVNELHQAGFQLEQEADFLRNPSDPRDQVIFKMNIPIDNFALRFVKP